MSQKTFDGSQDDGEASLRRRCAAWHATDPHLTAARETGFAQQIVDVPFVDRETLAAARMAIRMNWPLESLE